MPNFAKTRGPEETSWPTCDHEGRSYAINQYGEILVWRCSSRRTGRYHWVSVRNPPSLVAGVLLEKHLLEKEHGTPLRAMAQP